jgi:hypothetical protein
MKKIFFLFSFLFVCSNFALGQNLQSDTINQTKIAIQRDTNRYLRFGLIPYQIFSRSSGVYLGLDLKGVRIENKFLYTYETSYEPNGYAPLISRDNWYYKGFNNYFSLYRNSGKVAKKELGIILVYRFWWYNNRRVGEYARDWSTWAVKSSSAQGFGGGLCYNADLSKGSFDFNFFMDGTLTFFIDNQIIYSTGSNSRLPPFYNETFPYHTSYNKIHLNYTFGLKFGYRKKLK